MKGETAIQRRMAAKAYFAWQEFILDEWHPEIDRRTWPDVKVSTAKLVF
jgi:hypothetical protein